MQSAANKNSSGSDAQLSCITLINGDVLARNLNGHMQSQVLSFASSVIPGTRTIYFSRVSTEVEK